MGDTSIEWTSKTWNPVRGCRRVSPGCVNCYAERQAIRMAGPGGPYEGLVRSTPNGPRWTGSAHLIPEMLDLPLTWKKPQRVFVNSMSDLFHEDLPDIDIAAVFGVMAAAPQHSFQILTKRPERMRAWFAWAAERHPSGPRAVLSDIVLRLGGEWSEPGRRDLRDRFSPYVFNWPLPNVWLGVSVEDQEHGDERVPILLDTPAAVHFVSYEPALGPWDPLQSVALAPDSAAGVALDWIIAGAESGPGARPAERDWYRAVRDACAETKTAFFLKQHVERGRKVSLPELDGRQHAEFPRG